MHVGCPMPKERNVLLISYYWPPSGGAGVQRWLKMAKYLCRLGWKVTVYTPDNPDFYQLDPTLLDDVPAEVVTLKRRIIEPNRWLSRRGAKRAGVGLLQEGGQRQGLLYRLALWLRANVFVPDARMLWIGPSVRYLKRWLREHPQSALITTGPPHSMHMIGLRLHRMTGLPWMADFRDPWTNIDYAHHMPMTAWARRRQMRMERDVVREANVVLAVTPGMQAEYEALRGRPVQLVMNGFDEEDIEPRGPMPEASGAAFTLLHLGSLNADRNPHLLWHTLQRLVQEGKLVPGTMRVQLVGSVDDSVRTDVSRLGLDAFVEMLPSMPHSAVMQRLQGASALLLCINATPNSKGILTGKLFEYLASRRPIVSIGPRDGDAARIVREAQAGSTFDADDADALGEHLIHLVELHHRGALGDTQGDLQAYSRRMQAECISHLLEEML